jgi:hypothetical protein
MLFSGVPSRKQPVRLSKMPCCIGESVFGKKLLRKLKKGSRKDIKNIISLSLKPYTIISKLVCWRERRREYGEYNGSGCLLLQHYTLRWLKLLYNNTFTSILFLRKHQNYLNSVSKDKSL